MEKEIAGLKAEIDKLKKQNDALKALDYSMLRDFVPSHRRSAFTPDFLTLRCLEQCLTFLILVNMVKTLDIGHL